MAAPKPPAVSGAGTPSCWPRDFNAGHIERRDRHWLQIPVYNREHLQPGMKDSCL